jgi:hypothetical protein
MAKRTQTPKGKNTPTKVVAGIINEIQSNKDIPMTKLQAIIDASIKAFKKRKPGAEAIRLLKNQIGAIQKGL